MSTLLEWLRDEVAKHDREYPFSDSQLLPFGSYALFNSGNDRDFMIDLKHVPEHLKAEVPSPTVDPAYQEPFSRVNDTEKGFDFLICDTNRVAEFRHAMGCMEFMGHDRYEEFALLKANKPLRVAVFRMARSSYPQSELKVGMWGRCGDHENPDIDSQGEQLTLSLA